MEVGSAGMRDATRRTRLANERTYLAWWRAGLTPLAVCGGPGRIGPGGTGVTKWPHGAVGGGRIVPGVTGVTKWPYEAVGAAYGIIGVAFMFIAHHRLRSVERAVDAGG